MGHKALAALDYLTKQPTAKWEQAALRFMLDDGLLWDGGTTWVVIAMRGHELAVEVANDYASVGDEECFVRCPLSARSAQTLADANICMLPTPALVDRFWSELTNIRLRARPIVPTLEWREIVRHNAEIQDELLETAGPRLPELVVGHKKDVVQAAGVKAGRVAIYGWHGIVGTAIQPLNKVSHDDLYYDYSHGIRLVRRACVLDGSPADLTDVLADSELAYLVSDEGAFRMRYGD